MAEFRRAQVETIIQRLAEPPRTLVAVFGPRQSGKTTAVRQALASIPQGSRYETADSSKPPEAREALPSPQTPSPEQVPLSVRGRWDAQWLVSVWEECRSRAWQSRDGYVLALDEIQMIDDWSSIVKGLWDADRAAGCPLHVIILGSAPLLMQDGLNESLAGRFELVRFTHWSYPEMAAAFDFSVDQFIYFGGYPGAVHLVDDPSRWRDYVRDVLIEPNIERDVLGMTRVDKPALLKRLFEAGTLFSGQILSYNKLLGHLQDPGINNTTLSRYMHLLFQAGLLAELPNHTKRPLSAKASIPKLNALNTALMAAVSDYSFDEAQADRGFWGRMVESAVGAHLINTASSNITVRYWRDGDDEVDFVLKRGQRLVGIEVKTGRVRQKPPGLSAFEERFQPQQVIIVGEAGVQRDEFLSQPADHWFEDR